MKTILCVLIAVLGLSFSAQAKKPKANPVPEMVLFDAETVLKMNDLQREQYLEALRDYMDEAQAKDPTFAQYLMDVLLGSSVAHAQRTDDQCQDQWFNKKRMIGGCYDYVMSKIENTNCTWERPVTGSNTGLVNCNGMKYTVQDKFFGDGDTRQWNMQNFNDKVTGNKKPVAPTNPLPGADQAAALGGAPSAVGPTVPKGVAGGEQKEPQREAPKADDKGQKAEKKDEKKEGPARCFYAGFLIQVDADSKKNKCEPVSDYCTQNSRVSSWTDQVKNLDICKGDASGGKCPSAADKKSTVKSKGAKSKEESVVCNPALYGTDEQDKKEQVICVARGGDASSKCREKAEIIAKRDKDKYKDRLKKQLEGNAQGFDKFVRGLAANCNYRFKLDYNSDKGEFKEMKDIDDKEIDGVLKENEKAGGWSKTGRTDFKKTCQVLLKRTAEIGVHGNETMKKSITEVLKGAPAGGTK